MDNAIKNEDMKAWTVILVDDELDNLDFTQRLLEFYGAKVHIARNGIDGVTLFDTVVPTFILLDLSMPKMDGWEMIKRVRNLPAGKDVPIIALTAHAMSVDRSRVFQAGFDGYITKPFRIRDLLDEIRRVLHSANEHRLETQPRKPEELKVLIQELISQQREGLLNLSEQRQDAKQRPMKVD